MCLVWLVSLLLLLQELSRTPASLGPGLKAAALPPRPSGFCTVHGRAGPL